MFCLTIECLTRGLPETWSHGNFATLLDGEGRCGHRCGEKCWGVEGGKGRCRKRWGRCGKVCWGPLHTFLHLPPHPPFLSPNLPSPPSTPHTLSPYTPITSPPTPYLSLPPPTHFPTSSALTPHISPTFLMYEGVACYHVTMLP